MLHYAIIVYYISEAGSAVDDVESRFSAYTYLGSDVSSVLASILYLLYVTRHLVEFLNKLLVVDSFMSI